MLKQLSRLEKTRNFILLAFVILMAVSLIFFYAPRSETQQVLSRSQETLATVGGETITVGEVALRQENQKRQYAQFGGQGYTPPAKQVLEGEIGSRIVRLEAARLGLSPTDEEVGTEIRKQFKAANVDVSDRKKYNQIVTENFGGVTEYEQGVRDQIAQEKLQAYLTSGVSVSEDEVVDDYNRAQTTFDLVYVPVASASLASKIQMSDDELRQYFEKNKATYRIDVPQKKIRYLFVNQAKVGEKIEVPAGDIQTEYDQLAPDKKQKGVEAQQIVIRFSKTDETQKRAKADEVVQEIRQKGATISAEDFAAIARSKSEDPATATSGAKVKGVITPNPNNPTEPLQQILKLQEGQISEPTKAGNAFYIFRRGAAVAKTVEESKQEITVSLRYRRAYKAAADLSQAIADKVKAGTSLQDAAKEFAGQANMKPEEMIRETAFIKPGDDVPNIGVSAQFEQALIPLEQPGAIGERTPIKDGFAIPQLVEKRDPRDAEFDEVKEKIVEAAKLEKAKSALEQTAKDIAANSNSIDALRASADKAGLKAADAKDYKLGSPLGEGAAAATAGVLDEAIYALKPGEITKTPIKAGETWYVVGAAKRTDASKEEFAKQRDELVQRLAAEKQNQIFSDYLANARQALDKSGQLKINKDALAKIDVKPEVPELN